MGQLRFDQCEDDEDYRDAGEKIIVDPAVAGAGAGLSAIASRPAGALRGGWLAKADDPGLSLSP